MKTSNLKHQTSNIKLLYIITKSVWGGAAKYIFDLATHLPKDEFTIAVAAGGQERFAKKIIEADIPYFEIKNFQRKVHLLKEPFAFLEIFRLFLKLKPDIVHVNSSKAGGLVGLTAFIYRFFIQHPTSNIKHQTIFTAHGWAFAEDRPKWQLFLIKFFSKLTALFYDKIICVSEYDRQIAMENKIALSAKLITIHNGIDINQITFLPKEKARRKLLPTSNFQLPTSKVIGTIAEWTKNKGLIYLLEALTKLQTSNIKHQTILIGSGENPDKEKMYNFVRKYKLKNVYLIEWIDNAASYLKAFDIFVLPSVKEGFPYTILEAMAAEVPIVATEVGGVPEIMWEAKPPTYCGRLSLLVPPKNSQQLAEKILYLINNPNKGREMARQAKEKVIKEFTLEKMVGETKKLYIQK